MVDDNSHSTKSGITGVIEEEKIKCNESSSSDKVMDREMRAIIILVLVPPYLFRHLCDHCECVLYSLIIELSLFADTEPINLTPNTNVSRGA